MRLSKQILATCEKIKSECDSKTVTVDDVEGEPEAG